MDKELQKQKIRFIRLINGLIATVYVVGIVWGLSQLYTMIF